MNPLVSTIVLVLIAVLVIGFVYSTTSPIVESGKESAKMKEAENIMKMLDNYIIEVASEGSGSSRSFKFTSPGQFEVIPQEDAAQFEMQAKSELFEYLVRRISGNMIYISEADVNCSDSGNLVLENTYIKAEFQKILETSPHSGIDTKNNIISITEKTYNTTLYPVNSSIVIDDDPATSSGIGYSEISRTGKNLPVCQAHFYVNSSTGLKYDVYYKLYSWADFLVVEVRGIG